MRGINIGVLAISHPAKDLGNPHPVRIGLDGRYPRISEKRDNVPIIHPYEEGDN